MNSSVEKNKKLVPCVIKNSEVQSQFCQSHFKDSKALFRKIFLQIVVTDGAFQVESDRRVLDEVVHLKDQGLETIFKQTGGKR